MLFRKMLRDFKKNFGQFFSIFLLAMMALLCYSTFQGSVTGSENAREDMDKSTNIASAWVYGESFTYEDIQAVRAVPEVTSAQLRIKLQGKSAEFDDAQIDIILENENIVSMPYIVEGEEFNPEDENGIWVSCKFCDYWNLEVGDSFSFEYSDMRLTKTIKGKIASREYIYMCAENDLDIDVSNIAYVYMSDKDFRGATPYTELLFTTNKDDVFKLEDEVAEALDHNYAVFVDRKSIMGIERFEAEMKQHNAISTVFAVVFLLIAILVIVTSMKRIVENQRIQIGTLNAMGVKKRKILIHYMSYSFLLTIAGSICGMIIGIILGNVFVELLSGWYCLPGWKSSMAAEEPIMVAIVVILCTLVAYLSCRKLLKVHPSEALRPAPPKSGKKCLFEKLPLWSRLKFNTQYNLRDISRGKTRALMGVVGTMFGMSLMLAALGSETSFNLAEDWSFNKLHQYDYEVDLNETADMDEVNRLEEKYHGELVMSSPIEIARIKNALHDDKETTTITVIQGKGLYNITDMETNVTSLMPGEVALTRKLAESMGVEVGDTIYWHIYSDNDWYSAKVGVINRNPGESGLTMLYEDFDNTDEVYMPQMMVTNVAVSVDESEAITAVFSSEDLRASYRETMSILYVLVYFLVALSFIMIVIVLYNSGNLSYNERVREFATLKVLGMRSGRIRNILTIQNLWLSVIGSIAGVPLGKVFLQAMFDSNGDQMDYEVVFSTRDYILSFIFVLGIAALVSFMFSKRMKKLDMVEVLKGVD